MNDSLKTLRLLHQVLLLVAAAIFVLALTPDPSKLYRAALQELAALKRVAAEQNQYPKYLASRLSPSSGHSVPPIVVEALKAAGVREAASVKIPEAFASDLIIPGPRLTDYDDFFSRAHQLERIKLRLERTDPPDLSLYIRREIRIQGRGGDVYLEKVSISGSGLAGPSDGVQFIADLPVGEREAAILLNFRNPTSEITPRFSVPLGTTYELGQADKETFARDWLESTPDGEKLIDAKTKLILPELKRLDIWDQLSLMDLDSAISAVQKRLDSTNTETISFFGISVNKSVSVFAAPLTCLCIEWLFLLHFRRFSDLAVREKSPVEFPWIALFPGRASGFTIYVSLTLPVLASFVLVAHYGIWNSWNMRLGMLFALGSAATAVRLVFELWSFRRSLQAGGIRD